MCPSGADRPCRRRPAPDCRQAPPMAWCSPSRFEACNLLVLHRGAQHRLPGGRESRAHGALDFTAAAWAYRVCGVYVDAANCARERLQHVSDATVGELAHGVGDFTVQVTDIDHHFSSPGFMI